jgi:hypothetical protein
MAGPAMHDEKPVSEFFTGLVGVAVIGLLVAGMLFSLILFTGDSKKITYTDAQQTAPHLDTVPPPITN